MFCPYHGLDHLEKTEFNSEHIIPYALGGSDRFTIVVCKSSNSNFGSEIDGPFIDCFPIAYERFARNIKSANGNPPSLLFRGTTNLNGSEVQIEYEILAGSGEKKLVIAPVVGKRQVGDVTRYEFLASPDQVHKMLHSVDAKATRQGKHIVDKNGKAITPTELLAQVEVQRTVPEINCSWDYAGWSSAAVREFTKISLSAGHFFLGEAFSRSTEASLLRTLLQTPDQNLDKVPVRGTVWPRTVASPLSHLAHLLGDSEHIVALMHFDDKLVMFISFFGQINGLLVIATDPAICNLIEPQDGIVVQIDPISRTFQQQTLMELMQARPEDSDLGR